MLATRQGSLIVALVCAVAAAGILFFALNRYKTSLKPPVTQDTVLIATGEIAKGTAGTTIAQEKLYRSAPVAASQLTPGALTDASMLSSETTAVQILPGQQLTAADFAAFSSLSETLPPGNRAVTLSIGEAEGATDIVQAGDHVDIWYDPKDASPVPVLSNVEVLKPGNATPVKSQGVTIAGPEMVVSVANAEVPIVLRYAAEGSLYLTLRSTDAVPSAVDKYAAGLARLSQAQLSKLAASFPTSTK